MHERYDHAWFNLGVILEAQGRLPQAQEAYRHALVLNPLNPEAAGNLANLLVQQGDAAAAVPILDRALAAWPAHRVCWTNLVVALGETGDVAGARRAAMGAKQHGVDLAPGLLRAIGFVDAEERPGIKNE